MYNKHKKNSKAVFNHFLYYSEGPDLFEIVMCKENIIFCKKKHLVSKCRCIKFKRRGLHILCASISCLPNTLFTYKNVNFD